MVAFDSKKIGDWLTVCIGFAAMVLLFVLSSSYFLRIDMTAEKRFTIKKSTKELLRSLDDHVYAEVYLTGQLNPAFQRFQKALQETLEEFRIYSGNKFQYSFTDPLAAKSEKARTEFLQGLAQKGITPTNVVEPNEGQTTEKLIVPGAVISYEGQETGVMFLRNSAAGTADEAINASIEDIEFEVANAIYKLTVPNKQRIAWIVGHGELDSTNIAGFNNALLELYNLYRVDLSKHPTLNNYDLAIIDKPTRPYSQEDVYKLDQFIMHGGRALFLVDKLDAVMDSASRESYYAFPYDLGLDDMLFHYGVRLNLNLVEDRTCSMYPVMTGSVGGKPNMQLLNWPFYPLIGHYPDLSITRNLDVSLIRFGSTIDTVKAVGIRKTPLLLSSDESRAVGAPVKISVNDLRSQLGSGTMTGGPYALGYLLEGKFSSCFKNLLPPTGEDTTGFRADGVATKMVVIADGDIARNEIDPRTGRPLPLGFDMFANHTFANQDLLMNVVSYLAGQDNLISARNKEIKIRPLDKVKVAGEKVKWQLINIVAPVALILIFGIFYHFLRRRMYARFTSAK